LTTKKFGEVLKKSVKDGLFIEVFEGSLERVKGIEPSRPAWKAGTLPLSYTRIKQT